MRPSSNAYEEKRARERRRESACLSAWLACLPSWPGPRHAGTHMSLRRLATAAISSSSSSSLSARRFSRLQSVPYCAQRAASDKRDPDSAGVAAAAVDAAGAAAHAAAGVGLAPEEGGVCEGRRHRCMWRARNTPKKKSLPRRRRFLFVSGLVLRTRRETNRPFERLIFVIL